MASKSENDLLIDELLKQTDSRLTSTPKKKETAVIPGKTEPSPVTQQSTESSERQSNPELQTMVRPSVGATPKIDIAIPGDATSHKEKISEHSHSKDKPKKKKKKKRKHKSAKIYSVLIALTIIVVISITLAMGIIAVAKDMLGIDGTETLILFTIPEGATTADIAESLHEQGIIEIPQAFIYFSRLSDADASYIAGDHEVSSSMAYESLISELTGSAVDDTEYINITFYEGITLYDAAQLLEENEICSADKFIYYFNVGGYGYSFEEYLPSSVSKLKFYRMEGYLFPDTYTFYKDMEPDDVVRKIYMNFNVKMTDEYYERMEELGLTLDELITFASIVQKEAGSNEDMATIASVFWNRLNNSDTFPKLQSDVTYLYVENVIKPNMELVDELIYDAYDTYTCTGLPIGAISNPGIAAIEAVLYPEETSYFYFYANTDTLVTYFAETYEEHLAIQEMVEEEKSATEEEE